MLRTIVLQSVKYLRHRFPTIFANGNFGALTTLFYDGMDLAINVFKSCMNGKSMSKELQAKLSR